MLSHSHIRIRGLKNLSWRHICLMRRADEQKKMTQIIESLPKRKLKEDPPNVWFHCTFSKNHKNTIYHQPMFNSTPSPKPLYPNSPQVLDRSKRKINNQLVPLNFNEIGDYLVLDLELWKTVSEYGYILIYTISLQNIVSRLGIDLKPMHYNNKHIYMNTLSENVPLQP